MKSQRTKQCKRLSIFFGVLHFLCIFGPLLYYVPYAIIKGGAGDKLFLSLEIIVSIILAVFAIILDAKTRGGLIKTIMWLLILGITIALSEVKTFICIMAICAIVDELIIVKLRARYKDRYAANREIDRRSQ